MFALCALALALPASVAARAETPRAATAPGLSSQLGRALRGQWLAPGRTAALAIDLRTGKVLFAHNATRPFIPASNEKLPVSWAVLTRLGAAATIPTEVVGDGVRAGSAWQGDLILKGYGDPTLSSSDLDALARTIRARGIRELDGRVLADESFFDARRDAPGWKRGFLGIESPPLSALVVDRALGWPAAPPAILAARALRKALQRRGVTVARPVGTGRAADEAPRLARVESEPLAELVHTMNADSDNFLAEMLLKQLGAADGRVGTTARGARAVLAELTAAGIPTTGVRLVDGSGLSSQDRVTAQMLVGVLRAAIADPQVRTPFLRSLAVSGRSGTLADRSALPAGGVLGKTGTTNLACTLSGVLRRTFAFAVLQNGEPVASWAARGAQDRFVTALAQGTART